MSWACSSDRVRARRGPPAPTRMSQLALRSIYAEPPTFMEMLLECSQFIDKARHDPTSTKGDVLDSMETRVSFLVGKLASYPTSAAFVMYQAPPPPDG